MSPRLLTAAIVLSLTALGGCTVRDTPTTESSVAQQVREQQRLHLDLREPLGREEAGLDAGAESVAYDRRPPGLLDVRLQLPGDRVLDVDAISATIAATGLDGGPRTEPDYLLVVRVEPDAAAAESAVVADARTFGFPEAEVQQLLAELRTGRTGTVGVLTTQVGYLELSLELRLSEADRRVSLSYGLSWAPGPA